MFFYYETNIFIYYTYTNFQIQYKISIDLLLRKQLLMLINYYMLSFK